jgi:hypothetical protein
VPHRVSARHALKSIGNYPVLGIRFTRIPGSSDENSFRQAPDLIALDATLPLLVRNYVSGHSEGTMRVAPERSEGIARIDMLLEQPTQSDDEPDDATVVSAFPIPPSRSSIRIDDGACAAP